MNTNSFFYPFDPTGTAGTNLVSGERQVVNSPGIMDFFFIIPKAGPFFRSSLKVKLYPSGVELIEGVDYNPTHLFHAASHATGLGVYGSITFYDHTLSGTISLEYQSIGGDWVIDEAKILTILANTLVDPRITTWDEVVNLPYQFPIIAHEFNVDDFVGAEDIVEGIGGIRDAINAAAAGTSASHLLDFTNPHRVNKSQVGLSFLDNFPTATLSQAQQGTHAASFMTPLRVAQAIQALSWTRIDTHVQRNDNPHDTTKAHVGLGNVENYIIASAAEAENGSSNVRYMSPVRTKEAITAIAVVPLNAYIARRDNPNDVTATQVGLGNVSNYGTGTSAEAIAGTASNKFLVIREIVTAIQVHAGNKIDAHIANINNPHQVTKAHIGLDQVNNFPIATGADATVGESNAVYTTPATVRQMIGLFGGTNTGPTGPSVHESLTNNPHTVTATQVGLGNVSNFLVATKAQAEAGTASNLYMTPETTKYQITAAVGTQFSNHITDINNPHGTTPESIGTYNSSYIDNGLNFKLDIGATAADSNKVYGQTKPELLSDIVALTVDNSIMLNGKTLSEIVAIASTGGTSDDSLLLNGKTASDILLDFIDSGRAGANQSSIVGLSTTFNPAAPLTPIIPTESWTKIGVWAPTDNDINVLGSISFIIEGGGSGDFPTAPVALCSFAINASMWSSLGSLEVHDAKLSPMSPVVPGYDLFFKYATEGVTDSFVVEIWMRNGELRNSLSVTELTGRKIRWNAEPAITDSTLTITASPITNLTNSSFKSAGTPIFASNMIQSIDIVSNWLNNL
jgi:hypothetical protein